MDKATLSGRAATVGGVQGGLATFAAQSNILAILLGLILVWFVRGRVGARSGRVTEDS